MVNSKPDSSAKSEALEELHRAEGWSLSHLNDDFDNRKSLAEIFTLSNEAQEFNIRDTKPKKLAVLLDVTAIGISDTVTQVYEIPDRNISELFCAPLNGDTLPLDNLSIAREDLSCRVARGTHNKRRGKEKSWLNALLEKPDNRVIGITNHVNNIHPSVMRQSSSPPSIRQGFSATELMSSSRRSSSPSRLTPRS